MQLLPKPQRDSQLSKLSDFAQPPERSQLQIVENSEAVECGKSDRVVIFIDGANLFYAAAHLNIDIDYTKLLYYLIKGRRLVRAYFYTGVDRTNEKQQSFLMWMRHNGYRVITKDVIQLPDGSKKANLDVEIAVDMMKLASYCDGAVLVSGDGDLAYVVNALSYQGVKIEVVSLYSMISDSLIKVADCYTDLATIKQDIQKV
jgi:uncharacterized LabA/DUF88 family protein